MLGVRKPRRTAVPPSPPLAYIYTYLCILRVCVTCAKWRHPGVWSTTIISSVNSEIPHLCHVQIPHLSSYLRFSNLHKTWKTTTKPLTYIHINWFCGKFVFIFMHMYVDIMHRHFVVTNGVWLICKWMYESNHIVFEN